MSFMDVLSYARVSPATRSHHFCIPWNCGKREGIVIQLRSPIHAFRAISRVRPPRRKASFGKRN